MSDKIKALIVDDTITYRKIIRVVLESISNVEILGTAPNGSIALRKIKNAKPDLVLLDVEMPGINGLETLKKIKAEYPLISVIMVSAASEKSADITIKCLEAGAMDFIEKPSGLGMEKSIEELTGKLRPLLRFFNTRHRISNLKHKKKNKKQSREKPKPKVVKKIAAPTDFDILAIGVSTGGPEALSKLIPHIEGNFPIPIVIVQHMPPVFTASLARNLDKKSIIDVKEASDGEILKPSIAYIAPGGRHMIIRKRGANAIVGLLDTPPVNSCKPSVDVLFRSVGGVFPAKTLSVILTGMGNDGLEGVKMLKRKGTFTITQNKESCVVYGMPRAIEMAGLSDISIPVEDIAMRIMEKVNKNKKVA